MGGSRRGVDMGPSAFRIAGLREQIAALGRVVVDRGDLPSPIPETRKHGDPRKRFIKEIAKVCDRLYQTARASIEEGAIPLVLGGDHSLGAGSVAVSAAHARAAGKPLGLLWVDAHGDMNTPASTPSGNVHGMPLAALLGPEPAELSSIGGFSPTVLPQHTALVGADLQRMQGNEAEAEATLRAALEASPGNADLRHALGLSLVRQQRIAEALRELAARHRQRPTTRDMRMSMPSRCTRMAGCEKRSANSSEAWIRRPPTATSSRRSPNF